MRTISSYSIRKGGNGHVRVLKEKAVLLNKARGKTGAGLGTGPRLQNLLLFDSSRECINRKCAWVSTPNAPLASRAPCAVRVALRDPLLERSSPLVRTVHKHHQKVSVSNSQGVQPEQKKKRGKGTHNSAMLAPDDKSTTSFGYRLCENDGRAWDMTELVTISKIGRTEGEEEEDSGEVPRELMVSQESRRESVCGP